MGQTGANASRRGLEKAKECPGHIDGTVTWNAATHCRELCRECALKASEGTHDSSDGMDKYLRNKEYPGPELNRQPQD